MNAKARTERSALKARVRTNRAAAKISRKGSASLATHAMAAGLGPKDARSMTGSLRKHVAKHELAGTPGRAHAARRMQNCTRYTPAQVALAQTTYKPRRPEFRTACAILAQRAA